MWFGFANSNCGICTCLLRTTLAKLRLFRTRAKIGMCKGTRAKQGPRKGEFARIRDLQRVACKARAGEFARKGGEFAPLRAKQAPSTNWVNLGPAKGCVVVASHASKGRNLRAKQNTQGREVLAKHNPCVCFARVVLCHSCACLRAKQPPRNARKGAKDCACLLRTTQPLQVPRAEFARVQIHRNPCKAHARVACFASTKFTLRKGVLGACFARKCKFRVILCSAE